MISCSVAGFRCDAGTAGPGKAMTAPPLTAEGCHQKYGARAQAALSKMLPIRKSCRKPCKLRVLFIAGACPIMRHNPFCPQLRPATGNGDKIGKKTARREKIKKGRDPTLPQRDRKIGWR
jgi:hypothetical protein